MILVQQELNKYLRKIKEHHAKITPQRIEILNIFLNNKDDHFTAEDILRKLNESKTGQATVYRTLELFCSAGILKKVNFKNEEFARYDLLDLDEKHFHHHLVCNNCGKVIEISDDLLDHIENKVQTDYHFQIMNHELILSGICQECQTSDNNE
ncbi:transcriptional repressor [Mycoplasmatota bacterium]|nr:transcriptional repressor [Mycoplasmatota bacterium]